MHWYNRSKAIVRVAHIASWCAWRPLARLPVPAARQRPADVADVAGHPQGVGGLRLGPRVGGLDHRHDLGPDGFGQGGQTAGQVRHVGGQVNRGGGRRCGAGICGKCATFCAACFGLVL